jgi:hypothetical protein
MKNLSGTAKLVEKLLEGSDTDYDRATDFILERVVLAAREVEPSIDCIPYYKDGISLSLFGAASGILEPNPTFVLIREDGSVFQSRVERWYAKDRRTLGRNSGIVTFVPVTGDQLAWFGSLVSISKNPKPHHIRQHGDWYALNP